jgi:hypothetical protein
MHVDQGSSSEESHAENSETVAKLPAESAHWPVVITTRLR